MGAMDPLDGWAGLSALALANQTAITNNWSTAALKNAALGTALGNSHYVFCHF